MKKILNAFDLLNKTTQSAFIVVYGQQESGKSSLVQTITKDYKTLYIDSEKKIGYTWKNVSDKNKNQENLMGFTVDNIQELHAFLQTDKAMSCDVIVIDSMTDLIDKTEVSHLKKNYQSSLGTKNNQFQFYTDLPVYLIDIFSFAERMGVNVIMTFQSSNEHKDVVYDEYGKKQQVTRFGEHYSDTKGSGVLKTIKKSADLVVYLERIGTDKRRVWVKAAPDFAVTKSKFLPPNKPEYFDFDSIDDFSMDTVLMGQKLKLNKPEKISKERIENINGLLLSLDNLRTDGKKTDIAQVIKVSGIKKDKISDLMSYDADKIEKLLNLKIEALAKQPKKDEK